MSKGQMYFDDLDRETIYGTQGITESEDLEVEVSNKEKLTNFFGKLYGGTVTAVDKDRLTVDIQHGEVGDVYPDKQYRGCKIMNMGTTDENDVFDGDAKIPKKGSKIIYAFLVGVEDQPIILGTILTREKTVAVKEVADNAGEDDQYYRNGKLKIYKKKDGEFKIENDNAEFEMLNDGNININKGGTTDWAARKNDEIKSTSVEDAAYWAHFNAFLAVFQTWVPVPMDGGLALKTLLTAFFVAFPAPTAIVGKITKASDTTKIGGASA